MKTSREFIERASKRMLSTFTKKELSEMLNEASRQAFNAARESICTDGTYWNTKEKYDYANDYLKEFNYFPTSKNR